MPFEEELLPVFDRALEARNQARWDVALAGLDAIVTAVGDQPSLLAAHASLQIGMIYKRRDDHVGALQAFARAAKSRPTLELASLALFHALWRLGRRRDALREMIRFVHARDSEMYRELIGEDVGYERTLPEVQRAMVAHARMLLARHVSH